MLWLLYLRVGLPEFTNSPDHRSRMSLLAVQQVTHRRVAGTVTRRCLTVRRAIHIENKVYQNMPFDYRNRRAFGVKLVAFLGTGFALPFVAVWFQQSKSQS
ncbi:hypothetical protein P389DRAFT_74011 [Cystobasidium minutum MCA 4210]|uniref:uncharacterized protein n=1 Tax=Cystobasidium minutum MCA 4210 TaxID=1397322 RepID=UPI0034CF0A10|eukprot:jgi/Rhomi1/74011/CE74010_28292